jgi:hypothetical protein
MIMTGLKDNTIKLLIRRKLDSWLETITDKVLVDAIKQDVFVTGGCIASMLLDEKVNDYDIYFKSMKTTKAVAEYYVNTFNTLHPEMKHEASKAYNPKVRIENRKNIKGEMEERVIIYMQSSGMAGETEETYQYFEGQPELHADEFINSVMALDETAAVIDAADAVEELTDLLKDKKVKYRPLFLTENAITLSDKIQLIMRFYGDPEQVHLNYDFVHCTGYYVYSTNTLHISNETMRSLLSRSLVYNGSLYPVASVFRIRKFIARGWRITAGQILKMLFQLNQVDLTDKTILREQLIGVDQAYMHQLLDELNKTDGKIDATYMAKVIDRIFE